MGFTGVESQLPRAGLLAKRFQRMRLFDTCRCRVAWNGRKGFATCGLPFTRSQHQATLLPLRWTFSAETPSPAPASMLPSTAATTRRRISCRATSRCVGKRAGVRKVSLRTCCRVSVCVPLSSCNGQSRDTQSRNPTPRRCERLRLASPGFDGGDARPPSRRTGCSLIEI